MSEQPLRLIVPTLAGGRIRAQEVIGDQLPDRDFEGRRIEVDLRGVLAASESFIDEIVGELACNRGADLVVVNALIDWGDEFLDAARRHDVTDLVAVRYLDSTRWAIETPPTPINPSDSLRARLTAFARDCTLNGDITPAAEQMMARILEES